ncbi:MAG: C25 family cysteine peptidase [candidate division WOR-3 bacterium]|nr:C25 family cysteine peptidase [candidate division WOR-3 bacterium]
MQKVMCSLVLLISMAMAVQTVSFEGSWGEYPQFNVVSETRAGLEIVFSLHEMLIEDMELDGVPMQSYGLASVYIPQAGAPSLGGATRYVAIPQGARAEVVLLDYRTEVYHGVEVLPAPNIPLETDDKPLRYEKDLAVYGRDAYFPASPVLVSEPMQIRGVDVVIMNVTPFQYNPVTKELVVYKDLRFRLDFVGGNGRFGEDRLRSRFWEPILQGHLLNYASLPPIDFYAPERVNARDGWEYVIIIPDDPVFEAWADTIKAWRKLQGISCEVFTLTEVGGSSASAIESFLNTAYATWDPAPAAFLLLSDYPSSGDLYGITTQMYGSGVASDNMYADVNSDHMPDMHHARICAQSESQLSTMINKFLSYERQPYTAANFYNNPLMAVGWQTERWFQLCGEIIRGYFINEQGKDPARQYAVYLGTPTVGGPWSSNSNTYMIVAYFGTAGLGYIPDTNPYDASWWNNGSATGITNAINSGCFLLQHRDHGMETGWGEPSYTNSNLSSLTNTMYTFVNSSNCLTGKYIWSSECFTEKFHRIQYGAMGLNAASEISYSFVNDTYVWGSYDCLWPDFMPAYPVMGPQIPIGQPDLLPCMAMTSGKYFLQQSNWPYNTSSKTVTYHLFHHHGDAFSVLYSEIPQNLTVAHAPTLAGGVTSFTVTADDSSVIALTVNGEIIAVEEGTGTPQAITIPSQNPGNTMIVTVTKANHYRYAADVPIVSSTYPYVTYIGSIVDDATGGNGDGIVNPGETIDLGIWAKNVGIGTAQSVYGMLEVSDTCAVLTTDSSWYGNIAQDDSILSNPYYNFSIIPCCPNGHTINFTLNFCDTNDSMFTSYPAVTVYAPVLTYQSATVIDGGNGIVDPGETVDIVVTIENEGGAAASNVTSLLMTTSGFVTINDNVGIFDDVAPGDTSNNSADPYTITADSLTPIGTAADFQVVITSGVYVDTLEFSLVIGKKHYYIWNPDPTPTPGQNMYSILDGLGYTGDIGGSLAPDLILYQSVFVCVGIYASNFVINSGSAEAAALVNYLQTQGGRMYLEGGDVWYYDPLGGGYNFCPLFGISAISDGSDDMGPVLGEAGTFTAGMNFNYAGENNWMDHINPTGSGFLVFRDGNNNYNCGVANDAGTYRTVGTSFELGMLVDGAVPSTRAVLLDSIMHFFGITVMPGVEEGMELAGVPLRTALAAVYPNPVLRVMSIRYQLAREAVVELVMYDAAGRLVRTFADGMQAAGYYTVQWDGCDDLGRKVPAGVYFVRLDTDDYQDVQKTVLLK